MRKKLVRGMLLMFAFLMIVSTSAFAMDMRASSRIENSSARVKAGMDGKLLIYFSVDAVSTMDDIGADKIIIQRYSGSRWITESTLTSTDTPDMQGQNASDYFATIPYTPEYSGYAYRAIVSIYAKDSSGTSTASVTSTQVTM